MLTELQLRDVHYVPKSDEEYEEWRDRMGLNQVTYEFENLMDAYIEAEANLVSIRDRATPPAPEQSMKLRVAKDRATKNLLLFLMNAVGSQVVHALNETEKKD